MRFRPIGFSGTTGVAAPGQPNLRITVWAMMVGAQVDTGLSLRSGTTGTIHLGGGGDLTFKCKASEIAFALPRGTGPWFQCDVGEDLNILSSVSTGIIGMIAFAYTDRNLDTE